MSTQCLQRLTASKAILCSLTGILVQRWQKKKKKKRKNYAKVITDFEHTVPSLRQKKSGTELDED